MRPLNTLSLILLVPACGEPLFGDLTLLYTFDGLLCDAAGVEDIDISAEGEAYGDRWDERISCARFLEGVSMETLRTDRYDVRIIGLSETGVRLYETVVNLRVRGGIDQAFEIDVPFTVGDLTIFWSFDGAVTCGPVDQVHVRLVDPFDIIYDDASYDCAAEGVFYADLQSGDWIVRLDGIDPFDRMLFRSGARTLTVLPDSSNEFDVELGAVP